MDNIANAQATHKPSFEQETAIDLACDMKNRIVGITGGAGTGKTYILGRIYEQMCESHNVGVCAPTGRAARRIKELTGIEAFTIHKLLEYPMPEECIDENGKQIAVPGQPKRNATNPLDQDFILVDESSMISPSLYEELCAAGRRSVLRFIGDNQQLPPVEKGEPPFKSILEKQPSIELSHNFRSQDEIVSNANLIAQGRMPQRNAKFEIVYETDPLYYLLSIVPEHFKTMEYQIITPTRRGKAGTQRLNTSLQAKLNPTGPFLRLPRYDDNDAPLLVRRGDKVLWTKNDYQVGVYNGELGIIVDLDEEDGSLEIDFGDRVVYVPAYMSTYSLYHRSIIQYDPRRQIELGYAITTHKSQGSEFKCIFYLMVSQPHYRMLNRRQFYTAVTRAKDQVIVIADRGAMRLALRTFKEEQ